MDKHLIRRLVSLARSNNQDARRKRKLYGRVDTMALWHEGRSSAYMTAARMVQDGIDAKTRNAIKRLTVTA